MLWKMAVHLAVAVDVYDGVLFVLSFCPRDVLDELSQCLIIFLPTLSYVPKSFYYIHPSRMILVHMKE